MKYDCTRIFDYAHEVERMCASYRKTEKDPETRPVDSTPFMAASQPACGDCPFYKNEPFCSASIYRITQEKIDIVQKWSDEHPEKTRKEAFREIFPHIRSFDPQSICFKNLIGFDFGSIVTECAEIGCVGCWNEPYAGEFERAREEKE